jgi:hypothetical protein
VIQHELGKLLQLEPVDGVFLHSLIATLEETHLASELADQLLVPKQVPVPLVHYL